MININKIAKKINGSIEGDKTISVRGVGDLRTTEKSLFLFYLMIDIINILRVLYLK